MAPPIPAAPSVSASGYSSVAISWRKVPGSGNVNYTIFRNGVQVSGLTKDNDFSDLNLSAGTYSYTVTATDQTGTSGQSPGTSVTLPNQVLYSFLNGYVMVGIGDPTNVVIASPGQIWLRTNGGAGTTLYVKETGVNTSSGWAAK